MSRIIGKVYKKPAPVKVQVKAPVKTMPATKKTAAKKTAAKKNK